MWSVEGRQVLHKSGLSIEILDGSFANPLDLAVKGDTGYSAAEVAAMIREGMAFAAKNATSSKARRAPRRADPSGKSGRPILSLKK